MKNLLIYQSTEYDCGPTTLTNAIRYRVQHRRYYKESGISDEAQKEIVNILMREKRKNAARRTQEEA